MREARLPHHDAGKDGQENRGNYKGCNPPKQYVRVPLLSSEKGLEDSASSQRSGSCAEVNLC